MALFYTERYLLIAVNYLATLSVELNDVRHVTEQLGTSPENTVWVYLAWYKDTRCIAHTHTYTHTHY